MGVIREHFENQSTKFMAPENLHKYGNISDELGKCAGNIDHKDMPVHLAVNAETGYGYVRETSFQPPMVFKEMSEISSPEKQSGKGKGNRIGKTKVKHKEQRQSWNSMMTMPPKLAPGDMRRNEGIEGKISSPNAGSVGLQGVRGLFSSLEGSDYMGPMLADVAKTMRENKKEIRETLQLGSEKIEPVLNKWKRKQRDEPTGGFSELENSEEGVRKKMGNGGSGKHTTSQLEDDIGSGLAEAAGQPRRPQ